MLSEHEAVTSSHVFLDELALHSPAYITAFDLPAQTWRVVSVDDLTDVKWETKAMDHLVLEDEKKELLRHLVKDRNINMNDRVGDVISGKGRVSQARPISNFSHMLICRKGLIIVLHGPPGVGKTLTAGKKYPCLN